MAAIGRTGFRAGGCSSGMDLAGLSSRSEKAALDAVGIGRIIGVAGLLCAYGRTNSCHSAR
jgi:hypothetical protein